MKKINKKYYIWIITIIIIIIAMIFFLKFYKDIKEARCLERTSKEISEKGILSFIEKLECPLKIAGEAESISSVANYFICKSIVEDDLSICNKLTKDIPDAGYEKMRYKRETYFKLCRNFNLFFANFINRIEKEKICSKEVIDYCLMFMEGEDNQDKEEKCQNFCQAYLERNNDFCANPPKTNINTLNTNECLALMTGDKKYCNELDSDIAEKQCIAVTQYLLAIRSGDREKCSLIDTEPLIIPGEAIHPDVPNFDIVCDLFFDKKIEICDKQLDIFKEDYCKNK
jgi:hypothetical protein